MLEIKYTVKEAWVHANNILCGILNISVIQKIDLEIFCLVLGTVPSLIQAEQTSQTVF